MAKVRGEAWPVANWTSLIDVIFQLLIFFMVTLALGTVERQATAMQEGEEKEELPELPGMANLGEALEITPGTILIHVVDDVENEVAGDLVIFMLTDKIPCLEEARKDSAHTAGPFSWDVAYKKLNKKLDFARQFNEPLPRVEMRATKNMPYGYVLDVMKLCYHDDEIMRINQVYFRFARLTKVTRWGG